MTDIEWSRGFAIRRGDGKFYLGEEAGGVWFGLEKDACLFKDAATAVEVAEEHGNAPGGSRKLEVIPGAFANGRMRAL